MKYSYKSKELQLACVETRSIMLAKNLIQSAILDADNSGFDSEGFFFLIYVIKRPIHKYTSNIISNA